MFLSDACLKRPVAMGAVLITLVAFGVLSWFRVGYDIVPQTDAPYVTIAVVYPGATPAEIESSVARKIEDAASQVNGLKHMTTTCVNNFCQVLLEFEMGRNVDTAATDVREKLDLIRNDLPGGAELPKVLKYDINATAVVTMALTGDGFEPGELYDYADDRLASRFSVLPGVASVELIGGEKREVTVELDRARIAAKGLTLAGVIEKIGKGNLKVPAGTVDDGGRALPVTFDAEAPTPEALGELEIGAAAGPGGEASRIRLRDVATFGFGSKKAETEAYADGRRAVIIKVTKRGEANALRTVQLVRRTRDELRGSLPKGMDLEWIRDDGDFVQASVGDGLDAIWQSILLTGFILLLFLADWRTTFTAFVSIPVTVAVALIAFPAFGYTFNIITMSAFGISTGILVANSIVVLENIGKRLDEARASGGSVRAVIASATGEIALAVLASALTNVVVFLPLGTLRSMIGQIVAPFAVVITAATFSSLLVSFTLTPVLAAALGEHGEAVNRALAALLRPWNACYRGMERFYNKTLGGALRHPWLWMLLIVLVSSAVFLVSVKRVQLGFIPSFDRGELSLRLEYPPDSSLAQTAQRARALAARLAAIRGSDGRPAVVRNAVAVGKTQGTVGQVSQGAQLAEITLVMPPMTERPDSVFALAERIREACREERDLVWSLLVPMPVGGSGQQIQMLVQGDSFEDIDAIAFESFREILEKPSCSEVTHTVRPGRPEVRVYPNRAVLNDLGIAPSLLGTTLRASLTGFTPATLSAGGRSYDIRVRLRPEDGVGQLDALNFPAPDGQPFSLGALADVRRGLQRAQIVRRDKRRATSVYANPAEGYGLGTSLADVRGVVEPKLRNGCTTSLGGLAELMSDTLSEFGSVTVIAIALTYLLLAAVLESWVQPFIILLTVPFSYLGEFAILALTGVDFSVFGFLAGIMLVGVVVNAAILLLDERSALNLAGVPDAEAVPRAAAAKFRPILMSSAAALFGMLPMALGGGLGSELRRSIGIGSVGGILISSLVSLYFIPLVCRAFPAKSTTGSD